MVALRQHLVIWGFRDLVIWYLVIWGIGDLFGVRGTGQAEPHEGTVRQTPPALRELGVPLVPRLVLDGARLRADVLQRTAERAAARHEGAVGRRDPLGRVAEQIEETERVGCAFAHRVRA